MVHHPTSPHDTQGRIDLNQLQNILQQQSKELPVPLDGKKIISVAHHIPYSCMINDRKNVSLMDQLRHADQQQRLPQQQDSQQQTAVGRRNSVLLSPSTFDAAPISHLAKRRSSTLPSFGETEQWELSQRRGHAAMYAGIDSLKDRYRTLYIGATGNLHCRKTKEIIPTDSITEEERAGLCELLKSKHDIVPIFVPDNIGYGHYEGYCKQVLWPLLHYIMWNETVAEKRYWEDYVRVNQLFADQITQHYEDGDIS